jgi:Lrp/AsnC family leucine-responsive transcriptional regulator
MANSTGRGRPVRLDAIDLRILTELQTSAKLTNAALAERIGISPPSTLERVRKLEAAGIITGYVATLNAAALYKAVTAIVHVSLQTHCRNSLESAKTALSGLGEVQECWHTAGEDDFILKVGSMEEYEQFISRRLTKIEGLGRVRTAFVLSTVRQTTQVPLDGLEHLITSNGQDR